MHEALLSVEKIIELRKKGLQQVSTDVESMITLQKATRNGKNLVAQKIEGWNRLHRISYHII